MKIIILIMVLGILLLAFVGAVSLGIIENDFTENVLKIDSTRICEIEILKNTLEKKCNKETPKELDVNQNILSITKNPKTNVVRIKNE